MVSNHKLKDITHPLKMYIHVQRLFNPAISAKTIRHVHPTLQKAIDYAQKFDREFPIVEGIHHTEVDSPNCVIAPNGSHRISCLSLTLFYKDLST